MQTVISSLTEKIVLSIYGPVTRLEDIGTYVLPDGREWSSARDLYEYLQLASSQFNRWCNTNIEDNAFAIESTDYERLDVYVNVPNGGVKPAREYAIHPDFAAKLCMVSKKSAKAEEVRNFFVARNHKLTAIEQQRNQAVALSEDPDDLLLMLAQRNSENSKRIRALEAGRAADHLQLAAVQHQVEEVAAKQATIQEKHYTVAGWAKKNKHIRTNKELNALGRLASKLSKEQNYAIDHVYNAQYVTVGSYHVDILAQILPPIEASLAKAA